MLSFVFFTNMWKLRRRNWIWFFRWNPPIFPILILILDSAWGIELGLYSQLGVVVVVDILHIHSFRHVWIYVQNSFYICISWFFVNSLILNVDRLLLRRILRMDTLVQIIVQIHFLWRYDQAEEIIQFIPSLRRRRLRRRRILLLRQII